MRSVRPRRRFDSAPLDTQAGLEADEASWKGVWQDRVPTSALVQDLPQHGAQVLHAQRVGAVLQLSRGVAGGHEAARVFEETAHLDEAGLSDGRNLAVS